MRQPLLRRGTRAAALLGLRFVRFVLFFRLGLFLAAGVTFAGMVSVIRVMRVAIVAVLVVIFVVPVMFIMVLVVVAVLRILMRIRSGRR